MDTKNSRMVSMSCGKFMSTSLAFSFPTSSSPIRGVSCSSQVRLGLKNVEICISIMRGIFWVKSWGCKIKSDLLEDNKIHLFLILFAYFPKDK